MIWYIVGAVAIFVTGYLVGSNNPLPSVRAKIIKTAQDAVNSQTTKK